MTFSGAQSGQHAMQGKAKEESCNQEALLFGFQYGWPLYAYGLYLQAFPKAEVNVPYPFRNLATPDNLAVVRPNVDTLYTPLFFDLSQSDLEFAVPEFDDRFWLWPWYDMYGNNFGNVGSLQGFRSGKYLLRFTNSNFGVQTEAVEGGYLAYVNSPTPYGMLLNRILVKERTEDDLAKVHKLQDLMRFTQVHRAPAGVKNIPRLDLGLFARLIDDSNDETLGYSVMRLVAALSEFNPPEVLEDRSWVAVTLMKAGIINGKFTKPDGTDMRAAVSQADRMAADSRKPPGFSEDLGNGWTQAAAKILGDFKSFYVARMFSAQRGYLVLTGDQALYPGFTKGAASGTDRFTMAKDEAYLLTFRSGQPHLKETGFWSLTIYGENQYLIPNSLQRYNLGDRSGLTYLDGSLFNGIDGKQFQILIQAADVTPPAKWIDNWLPAPAGGGTFTTSFRFYGAQPSMSDGSWEYPVVSKIKAIIT